MKDDWLDLVSIALVGAVVVVACLDFLLGKNGRRNLQSSLETLWLRLSYIRWPTLGANEATAFVSWLDRTFGARLFSFRRLVSTTLSVAALIAVAYVVYEGARLMSGKPVRWPFIEPHWSTGFPVQVVPAMLSISITRLMVLSCLRVIGLIRGGTLLFLLAIAIAGYLSMTISFAVAFAFQPFLWGVQFLAHAALDYFAAPEPVDLDHKYFRFFPLLWSRAMIGVSLAEDAFLNPSLALWSFHSLAQHNDIGLVRTWYDFSISAGFGALRFLFAIAFVGSWLLLAPLKWVTSVVLLRLAEAERGALTVVGAGLAILAKLIQEYLKRR